MSDITIAILVLPVLAALVVVLECGRIGCTKGLRRIRSRADTASAEPLVRS